MTSSLFFSFCKERDGVEVRERERNRDIYSDSLC